MTGECDGTTMSTRAGMMVGLVVGVMGSVVGAIMGICHFGVDRWNDMGIGYVHWAA
jgi:hypothetical protein